MKLQPQQDIIDIYDTYDNFMKAEKRAKNPFIIEKRKKIMKIHYTLAKIYHVIFLLEILH